MPVRNIKKKHKIMKKILAIKIVLSVVVAITIIAFSVIVVTPQTWLYRRLYTKQNMEETTGVSVFEASLNYDGIIEQILGRQKVQGMTTYDSSAGLLGRIMELRTIYSACRYICGFGMIIVIISILLLKDKKWYHCLNFGGLGAIGLSLLATGAGWLIRPLRLFVFKSDYAELFGNDPKFTMLIPDGLMLYYWLIALFFIFVIGFIFALVHLESRTDYTPHKF